MPSTPVALTSAAWASPIPPIATTGSARRRRMSASPSSPIATPGIGLGARGIDRTDTDVVDQGRIDDRHLLGCPGGDAQELIRPERGACSGRVQVILTDMQAGRAGGEGDLDPVVDDQGHAQGIEQRLQGPRLRRHLGIGGRLVAQLNQTDSAAQGGRHQTRQRSGLEVLRADNEVE